MTTLNTLGGGDPEPAEVSDASLAMADYDAKWRELRSGA